jgi:hypothetical protein
VSSMTHSTTLRVQLNGQAVDRLHERAAAHQRDLETEAGSVLSAALQLLPLDGRTVVLDGQVVQALEDLLVGGSLLSGEDLLQKVNRLAGISYGHVRLSFSPGQLEEIENRAARLSMSGEELIRRTAKKMEELFFTHLGVGSQG